MQLWLQDGLTFIGFHGTDTAIRGVTYFPTPGEGDGQTPITETVEVWLRGTGVQCVTAHNRIEALLVAAKRRQDRGVGKRIFTEYSGHATHPLARSEVLGGKISWPDKDEAMLRRLGETSVNARLLIDWERRGYWEEAEIEIRGRSKNETTLGTGGKLIFNTTDASRGNYFEIIANQIVGVLPAPCRVEMRNINGTQIGYNDFYIGTNTFSAAQTFRNVYEAESAAGGGAVQNDLSCSTGQKLNVTVNGTTSINWTMTADEVARCGGRTFRLFLRMVAVFSTPIYARIELRTRDGTVPLGPSEPEVQIGGPTIPFDRNCLIDLGELQIPPSAPVTTGASFGGAQIWLHLRSSASVAFIADFIHLMPSDHIRHLYQRGMAAANNEEVIDDGIEESAYLLEGFSQQFVITPLESPVTVYPSADAQRVYFLHSIQTGGAPVNEQTRVRLFYRPRRLTV